MSTPQTTNGRGSDGAQGPPPAGVAPPHSIEAEQSVLGAMLLSDRTHYAFVIEEGLKVEDFYRERHREVYESMLALFTAGDSIDVLTVTEHLRSRGRLEAAGGQAEIDALTAAVPAVGNLRQYAQIVRDRALLRRLLAASYEIQASVHGHEGGPREIVEWAERAVLEVAHDDRQKDFRQVGEVLHAEVRKWQELSAEGRSLTGTPSGFADLDAITGGFQPGNLIIIAARPSMGKCLGASSLVYDPMTGARRRMDDVVALIEGGEEVHVASVGSDLKLRATRATAAFRNGVRPLFRLTTRLGRRIEATANHPLLTISGWRRLDELEPGARIAVPRRLPRPDYEQTMPDHEIVMLAALIADGNVTEHTPRFCFGPDSPVLEEVEEAALELGARLTRPRAGHGTASISAGRGAPGNPVRELCERHGLWGLHSAEKFVPEAIFGLDEGRIERFLSVLYACDGHAYASDRLHQIGYSTISERLAFDVQHLLLRLGIVSRVRSLRRAVYDGTDKVAREVLITGQESLATFCSRIRVCGKAAPLARVVAGLRRVGPGTNVDTVPPAAWDVILAAKGARSWADVSFATGRPRNHNWHVGIRGLSRPLIGELAEATADEGLQALATSDLWWDEVASIEPIGVQETFDITVPGDHNFVADDVVVHNSALVTNMAENVALNKDHRRPVALFSLEMSEAELAQRFIASQASIKGDDLRKGRLRDEAKWKRVLRTAGEYDAAPLYVDDSSDIGIMDVRAKARRLHQQAMAEYGGLGLVIVDYLQLMRADSRIENRVQQVGEMSRGLKILARELSVPVIALSQLSRGVESRTDKRPMLSDLRECVTGDTLVVLADGRRVPIAELVGQTPDVLAVDATDRVVTASSDKVWAVGRRPVFDVRLASGRSLRATGEHRIRTGAGWQTVAELESGDRVALARELPEPSRTISWSDDRLILLGQLVGDGSYLSGQPLRYTTASEENSAAVAQAAEREFGARVTRHAGRGNWHQLVIAGNGNRWRPAGVNAWLRGLGIFDQRSHEKRLPSEVFQLPNEQIALLLRHLWATDGCLWSGLRRSNGRVVTRVYFSTASEKLAHDVAALMLRLGIVARIGSTRSELGSGVHHVDVSGVAAQRRFLAEVGAFGPRVAHAEKLAAALDAMASTTNVDTLPREVWSSVRAVMSEKGITQRAMATMRGTAYGGQAHFAFAPSRAVVAGYAELLGAPALAAMAESDLFWDRVEAVEPAGEEEVYDLTVPGPACWLADGIVSHNSGQIEQDADLVMFIYRDEYYFPETTDKPGEAELIIAKHRNGGLGDVPLTFQNEYPRFLGLQRAA